MADCPLCFLCAVVVLSRQTCALGLLILYLFPSCTDNLLPILQRFGSIGQFYFPDGVPLTQETKQKKLVRWTKPWPNEFKSSKQL